MLTIRLQRTGKKNKPEFRIILAEKTAAASKKFVEVLGHYNPRTKDFGIKNQERLTYWIEQHVQMSPTAHNLLVNHKLLDQKKVRAFNVPKKPVPAVEATPEVKAEEAPVAEAPSEEAIPEVVAETPSEEAAPETTA